MTCGGCSKAKSPSFPRPANATVQLSKAAIAGATKIANRIAGGDRASDAATIARREICRRCPMVVRSGRIDWCGEPITGKPPKAAEAMGNGCGCALHFKTACASEACPHGRWGAERQ